MKNMQDIGWVNRILEIGKQYKYACLILLLGIGLVVVPGIKSMETPQLTVETEELPLETRMEQLLQHVAGAGKVKVLLSRETGPVSTYQEDVSVFAANEETERKTETVLITANGSQTPIPVQTIYPTYKGAVVLAEGADRPSVKLNLIQAVSSLTGLRTDQITVIKMKAN